MQNGGGGLTGRAIDEKTGGEKGLAEVAGDEADGMKAKKLGKCLPVSQNCCIFAAYGFGIKANSKEIRQWTKTLT